LLPLCWGQTAFLFLVFTAKKSTIQKPKIKVLFVCVGSAVAAWGYLACPLYIMCTIGLPKTISCEADL